MGTDVRLVVLRHGETEWSATGKHTGATDVPLTDNGVAQARAVGEAIARLKLRDPVVITSPRQRAIRTAELAGLVAQQTWDDLAEWDYGNYEGLTTPQIRETVPHWTVWTHPCAGGETAESVQARADTVLSVVNAQLERRDVVLVGHGHFSRVLLARWAELPIVEGRRFALGAAGFAVLGYEHGARQIQSLNCTHA